MKNYLKLIIMLVFFILILLVGMKNVSATVECTRNVYSNNGSMKFEFSGLSLDTTHEYEFGLASTSASQPQKWFSIVEYDANKALVNIVTTTDELRIVFNATDTGYITIKDKTANSTVIDRFAVDLKIPYMQVTDLNVINNGKEFEASENKCINVPIRNAENCSANYQYEKITDQNLISKYKELKSNNGNYLELQNLIKSTVPSSNWKKWDYFNGHNSFTGMDGFGYPENSINLSDNGLYYMWLYFSGKNVKNIYGCILVDNLEKDVALQSISLPSTQKVELEKTVTLIPTYNPTTATNKIVTWSSSDENVATIDNAGKVTPKKEGSTIITVTSKDGNKKATCTVTVVKENSTTTDKKTNPSGSIINETSSKTSNDIESIGGKSSNKGISTKDSESKPTSLPKTGVSIFIVFFGILLTMICSFVFYKKNKKLKGIK